MSGSVPPSVPQTQADGAQRCDRGAVDVFKRGTGWTIFPHQKALFFFVFWLKGVCLVSFFKKDGKIMSIFGEYVLKHCFFSHVLFKDHLEQL